MEGETRPIPLTELMVRHCCGWLSPYLPLNELQVKPLVQSAKHAYNTALLACILLVRVSASRQGRVPREPALLRLQLDQFGLHRVRLLRWKRSKTAIHSLSREREDVKKKKAYRANVTSASPTFKGKSFVWLDCIKAKQRDGEKNKRNKLMVKREMHRSEMGFEGDITQRDSRSCLLTEKDASLHVDQIPRDISSISHDDGNESRPARATGNPTLWGEGGERRKKKKTEHIRQCHWVTCIIQLVAQRPPGARKNNWTRSVTFSPFPLPKSSRSAYQLSCDDKMKQLQMRDSWWNRKWTVSF